MSFKVKKEFGVIGLGRFGVSVVETLLKYNVSVIVLDMDEEKIVNILVQWRARGVNIQEKLNECMKQANDVKLPEHI